ncbi:MAG: Peroxyureidoacrylate/ureidoacrylate amidohydrolase RutB [Tenericutes bacterium ADurb.Bin239]|nr:MAG: Peroxyureidoacrylate/ureidoacrylate amidohydrolase RutB [Tenericutes bacterium ADurb.Bin239]
MSTKTAFIVVDMVHDFVDPTGRVFYSVSLKLIPNINKALAIARKHNHLVIFIQHRYRKDKFDKNLENMRPCCIEGTGGEEITDLLKIDYKKDYIVQKRRYSSFFGTDLDLILRENNIKNIVLVGAKTNNCIHATVIDGYYLDYNVYVIRECVGTSDEETNNIYLRDIHKYLGKVISLDEFSELINTGTL